MNWEQMRAILWLRWRLTRNQMMRGKGVGAVIAALAAIVLLLCTLGAGVATTLVGALAMKGASVQVVMFVWDGVTILALFISLMGVLAEVQRSESIDLARLLHLPIGLRQVFFFNYLVSLVSLGTLLGLAIMLGLAAGMTIGRGPRFLLVMLLVLAFVFMMTAWIYCLRGWLLSLMANKRRRNTIVMVITFSIILVGQTPNLLNLAWQRKARADREARREAQRQAGGPGAIAPPADAVDSKEAFQHAVAILTQVHPWVPLLWLPNGARGAAVGEVLPALWGAAGLFALGWLGLRRAYRTTLRFYRAEGPMARARAKPAASNDTRKPRNWVEWRLPWVPEDAAALALAQCRSMTRAPEIRMALGMGLFMPILVPVMMFWGAGAHLPEAGKPFVATGVVAMILFMALQLACNQFGYDRDGFRGLVLLPTPRSRLLLGKNLALLPITMVVALVPLAAVSVLAKLSVLVVLATVVQFAAAFLVFCMMGNLFSILLPYRIAAGSLKPTKSSWQAALGMFGVMTVFPVLISPVFVPAFLGWGVERLGWLPGGPVNLAAALVIAALAAFGYAQTLVPLGKLLQRRETKILGTVTEALE